MGEDGARMVSVCVQGWEVHEKRVCMCVCGGGKGAQHYSPPKGVGDKHMGPRGSGCGICQQEKQCLEQKRRNSILGSITRSPRCPEGPVPWDGRAEGLLCPLPVPCRVVASPKGVCLVDR